MAKKKDAKKSQLPGWAKMSAWAKRPLPLWTVASGAVLALFVGLGIGSIVVGEVEQEAAALEQELQQMSNEHEETVTQLQDDLEAAESNETAAVEARDEAETDLATWKSKVSDQETQIEDLKSEVSSLKKKAQKAATSTQGGGTNSGGGGGSGGGGSGGGGSGGGTTYYANCDAVRAAGAAPIYSGDPGYSRKLDRDGDGVGCE